MRKRCPSSGTSRYLDSNERDAVGLKWWYRTLVNSSYIEEANAAAEVARRVLVPDLLVYMSRFLSARRGPTPAPAPAAAPTTAPTTLTAPALAPKRAATYVDFGHHVNLGLLVPLVHELQGGGATAELAAMREQTASLGAGSSRVSVVRIIRNR